MIIVRRVLASTKQDLADHLRSFVKELKDARADPKRFHKAWDTMAARGRVTAAGRGRFFADKNHPMAQSLQEEADGWGLGYMARKYQAMPEDAARPAEELRDTKGEEIPKWVVLQVMNSMKEDKAVGYDGIPITMWKQAGAARELASALLLCGCCFCWQLAYLINPAVYKLGLLGSACSRASLVLPPVRAEYLVRSQAVHRCRESPLRRR
jgi:hypothetical protein